MPIQDGMGQSWATTDKEDGLRRILEQHLAVVRRILTKYKSFPRIYRYIDMNAGRGYNEIADCDGSPLIFLRAVEKVPIAYHAQFVEIDEQNALDLQQALGGWNHHDVLIGDNREVVPHLLNDLPRYSFGLLYTDPNGRPDFELLTELSRMPQVDKLDILIRCCTGAVKRNIYQTGERLLDYLGTINKAFWIVREPERRSGWQWTFLLGLNWDGMRDMKHLGFHYAHSDRGQEILELLNHTEEELAALRQPSLFDADPPYSTYNEYLRHPQYRAIRALAIRRSGGTCEQCHKRPVTEVHHVQYPPWGQFDVPENLIAVCHQCHCQIHGKEN